MLRSMQKDNNKHFKKVGIFFIFQSKAIDLERILCNYFNKPTPHIIVSCSYLIILLDFVSFSRHVHGVETLPLVHCNKAVNYSVVI